MFFLQATILHTFLKKQLTLRRDRGGWETHTFAQKFWACLYRTFYFGSFKVTFGVGNVLFMNSIITLEKKKDKFWT